MRKLVGWLSALGVLLACGGDGSGVEPSENTNVAGSWNAIWLEMNGTGMSCTATGGRLELTQNGARFGGSYRVQTLTCNGKSGALSTGSVVNGSVAGNQVAFDLNDPAFHQSGSLNRDEMSGPATWTLLIDGTSYTVTGTWTASRTCGTSMATTAFSC
jgi:hypothetical protein